MKKIIKTLITLIVIIPILTLANGYATANNQTEPHRKMTADEIPQDQTDATEKLYKLGLFLPIQQNEDGTPNFALNYYTTRFQGIKIIINFTGTYNKQKTTITRTASKTYQYHKTHTYHSQWKTTSYTAYQEHILNQHAN